MKEIGESLVEIKYKKFAFVSAAAEREYKNLPEDVQDEFGREIRRIQYGEDPTISIKHLTQVGSGVVELIINGSPAYRCVYIAKYLNTVVVLHSFEKTTNGVDRPAMELVGKRLAELMAELKAN